jgi:glycosyltransferase involved in cell wall biosynthesis
MQDPCLNWIIHIYGNATILDQFPAHPRLHLHKPSFLRQHTSPFSDRIGLSRVFWKFFILPFIIIFTEPDLVFYPGCFAHWPFCNFVVINQNILPFHPISYYPSFSFSSLRLYILRLAYVFSICQSRGVIFLTHYAKNLITPYIKASNQSIIIPHGINPIFNQNNNRISQPVILQSTSCTHKFIYCSSIDNYKHQYQVLDSFYYLLSQSCDIHLSIIGPIASQVYFNFITKHPIFTLYPNKVKILPPVSNSDLASIYRDFDCFLFASSCENLPIILLEAFASGLPIICSDFPPMPDLFGHSVYYFNPYSSSSLSLAVTQYLNDVGKSCTSLPRLNPIYNVSWFSVANKTFHFFDTLCQ